MFEENLDTFLCDFGEPVTPQAGTAFTGIYNQPDLAGRLGATFTFATGAHTLLCKTTDAHTLLPDSLLTVQDTQFCVLENHPDGTGFSLLVITPVPIE
jgi:hypothetical protein